MSTNALQLQSNCLVKPYPSPLRVSPGFREELAGVLEEGDIMSRFVENAVRSVVDRRKRQDECVRRSTSARMTTTEPSQRLLQ